MTPTLAFPAFKQKNLPSATPLRNDRVVEAPTQEEYILLLEELYRDLLCCQCWPLLISALSYPNYVYFHFNKVKK